MGAGAAMRVMVLVKASPEGDVDVNRQRGLA
jgi:hypothetical protein